MRFAILAITAPIWVAGCSDDTSTENKQPGVVYPTEVLAELGGSDASGPAPFGIALDDAYLYVSVVNGDDTTGAVARIPKAGGAIERLAPPGSSRSLAMAGDTLFFDDSDHGSIQSVPASGGSIAELTTESSATELHATADTVFFAHSVINDTSIVGAVSPDSGELTILLETSERPSAIAVQGDTAYVGLLGPGHTATTDGSIVAIPVGGGEAMPVAKLLAGPRAMVVEDGVLYAVLQGTGPSDGAVVAVTLPSGPVENLVKLLDRPWGLAADETYLYWVNRGEKGDDGTIMRMTREVGTPEILADAQGEPRQLAVDDTHVYWTNYRSGQVMRVEKPGADGP